MMKITRKNAWLAGASLVLLLGTILALPREKRPHAATDSALIARANSIEIERAVTDARPEETRRDSAGTRASLGTDVRVEPSPGAGIAINSSSNSVVAFSGSTSVTPSRSSETQASPAEETEPEPVEAHLPAAFLPPPNVRVWNEDELTTVAALAKQFTDSVVGPSQGPSDPQYYYRWIDEERLANERYRSYFGNDAFNAIRAPGN